MYNYLSENDRIREHRWEVEILSGKLADVCAIDAGNT